ncbi:MAG TPA: HAD family hydrolase [Polyangiaceae bacterium]|nr:HAD family hydrolase [Polyangiaceae bacterium]
MQFESVDAVWTRIDRLARSEPGGVVATDADGTLWSGDLGEDLFHAFLDHGRVEPLALEAFRRDAREHALSDAGSGPEIARRIYDAYLAGRFPEERMCELMTWCFAGWPDDAVRRFARGVVAGTDLAGRFHPEVLRILDRVRGAGIATLLVSASPFVVIAEAGAHAGFGEDDVVAARPRYRDDTMLPEVQRPIPYAMGKVVRLKERLMPGASLYAAFGDNAFDIAMLASARVSVAVRPKERLRRRAAEVPGIVELTL